MQVFLNVPSISLLQWHPFTLSSSPTDPYCEINVRGLGGFTRDLLATCHALPPGQQLRIRVDGPYGCLSSDYRRFPVHVLCCGGIGVTPAIAMLRTLFCLPADEAETGRLGGMAGSVGQGAEQGAASDNTTTTDNGWREDFITGSDLFFVAGDRHGEADKPSTSESGSGPSRHVYVIWSIAKQVRFKVLLLAITAVAPCAIYMENMFVVLHIFA